MNKTPTIRRLSLLTVLLWASVASPYYDPQVQRWINRDPSSESGHQLYVSHQSLPPGFTEALNTYAFVLNNPADSVDLDGRSMRPRKYDPPQTPKIPKPTGPNKVCFYKTVEVPDGRWFIVCEIAQKPDPPDKIIIHPRNKDAFKECMSRARQIWNNAFRYEPPNIAVARRACARAQECFNDYW